MPQFSPSLPPPVSAEQAAAETYRQMFKDGNFCVTYRMKTAGMLSRYFSFVTLAGKDGKRMQRKTVGDDAVNSGLFGRKSVSLSAGYGDKYLDVTEVSIIYAGFNPNARTKNLFTNTEKVDLNAIQTNNLSDNKDWPDVLYKDGKYYRFGIANVHSGGLFGLDSSKRGKVDILNAKVLDEKNINSIALNSNEEWEFIRSDLALPDELAIFYWEDPMRNNLLNLPAPTFSGTSEKSISGKKYICDTYTRDIKNLAGGVIAQNVYDALYFEGKLELIQTYFLRAGKKILIREVEIKNITAEVPDELFTTNKKVNVYAAEIGDINDLLDNNSLVETWEAQK